MPKAAKEVQELRCASSYGTVCVAVIGERVVHDSRLFRGARLQRTTLDLPPGVRGADVASVNWNGPSVVTVHGDCWFWEGRQWHLIGNLLADPVPVKREVRPFVGDA